MSDEAFYAAATENTDIEINVQQRKIFVANLEFSFTLADMEYRLIMNKGMNEAYKKFGNTIWERLTEKSYISARAGDSMTEPVDERLRW
jgi:hypothetical protein